MKAAVYNWRSMLRDYARLVLDDKWYWCRHCHRPVEHTYVPADGEGPEALTCLDCGFADPECLRTIFQG